VQRHIARHLKVQVCTSGEYVYREGEIGSEIYFVLAGEVSVTGPDAAATAAGEEKGGAGNGKKKASKTSKRLGAGMHFGGETLYTTSGERTETVQCVTDCELYFVYKADFERILVEFPEHRQIGIFAELAIPNMTTVVQRRTLHKQVAELSGNVKNSPLAAFSSHYIDTLLGGVDTSKISGVPSPAMRKATMFSGSSALSQQPQTPQQQQQQQQQQLVLLQSPGESPAPALRTQDDSSVDRKSLAIRFSMLVEAEGRQLVMLQERSRPTLLAEQANKFSSLKIKTDANKSGMLALQETKHDDDDDDDDDTIGEDHDSGSANVHAAFISKAKKKANKNMRMSVTYEDAQQLLITQRRGLDDFGVADAQWTGNSGAAAGTAAGVALPLKPKLTATRTMANLSSSPKKKKPVNKAAASKPAEQTPTVTPTSTPTPSAPSPLKSHAPLASPAPLATPTTPKVPAPAARAQDAAQTATPKPAAATSPTQPTSPKQGTTPGKRHSVA
jgi:hypothetical protein